MGIPRSFFAQVLLSTVNGMDSARKVRESLVFAFWPRVVGEKAAEATEVEAVRDGVLFVRTRSSTWSHELTLHKERVLTNLNRLLGGRFITEIVYKARGISKKPRSEPETDVPSVEELDAVVLEPAETAELSEKLNALESISNDRIRSVMASRLDRDARLRHWRIERGWKLCFHCGSAHKTSYLICPICRLCR